MSVTDRHDALPPDSERPDDFDGLKQILIERRGEFPRRMAQCAEHVLRHPDEVALGTAAEIAAAAGVQPSTLVRFAQSIGFAGFSDMQRIFRARLTGDRPTYSDRLEQLRAESGHSVGGILNGFIENAHASLNRLERSANLDALDEATARLAAAQRIHLVGLRRSFPVVSYLHYVFGKLGVATVLNDGVGGVLEDLAPFVSKDDALIVSTFAPYAPEAVDFTARVYGRGVPVIALTDSALSPIARVATTVLEIREAEIGAFRSLSATLCVVMTLAIAVVERRQDVARDGSVE